MKKLSDYVPASQGITSTYNVFNGTNFTFISRFPVERIKSEERSAEAQKEIDYNWVAHILGNFDDRLWEPIVLDHDYYLIDGYHRLAVAKLLRLRYIDIIVTDNEAQDATSKLEDKKVDQREKSIEEFKLEQTTIWSFPKRGAWATHKSDYRGNFAPQVARNVILNYSKEGELILDPMAGSGTTLIEARLLNRNAIGYDVNQNAVNITKERLAFSVNNASKQEVSLGDIRNLSKLKNNSIDFILTHPPYANIIAYSNGKNPDDLSSFANIDDFLNQLERGIHELFRVLKPNRYCALLIGDTRKSQHYIPLSYFLLQRCLKTGFVLKEQIIKFQHNCRYAHRWTGSANHHNFYLIMHEHLFIFRKPYPKEDLSQLRYSTSH
jgi:DNA modification methylase